MGLSHIVLLAAQVEDKVKPMSERLGTGVLNTIMCMTTVFAVLYLICVIIQGLSLIGKLEQKLKNKNNLEEAAPQLVNVMETIAQQEEEELSDDLELVAVITSAIHAYEEACGNEVPVNGLYVRSVKKLNRTKWQNA